VQFSQLRKLRDFDLDLRWVEVTVMCIRGRRLPTHQIRSRWE